MRIGINVRGDIKIAIESKYRRGGKLLRLATDVCVSQQMKSRNRTHRQSATIPSLRFSPTAWAKLLFLRDYGDTEVGGFGITDADDLLFIEDLHLIKQVCSWAHVAFDDESVADFFDAQVDAGLRPEQFGRIWVHTHPGDCPQPSATDEATLTRVFGSSDWVVMFILASAGQSYARLRFNVGPAAEFEMTVEIDYGRHFEACAEEAWEREYLANVQPDLMLRRSHVRREADLAAPIDDELTDEWYGSWFDYLESEEGIGGIVV